eukprot:12979-Pelagococcus_subviridis.AAC.1
MTRGSVRPRLPRRSAGGGGDAIRFVRQKKRRKPLITRAERRRRRRRRVASSPSSPRVASAAVTSPSCSRFRPFARSAFAARRSSRSRTREGDRARGRRKRRRRRFFGNFSSPRRRRRLGAPRATRLRRRRAARARASAASSSSSSSSSRRARRRPRRSSRTTRKKRFFRRRTRTGFESTGTRVSSAAGRRWRGLNARDGRRDAPGKVLKDRRSPRRRGRMGTSVRNSTPTNLPQRPLRASHRVVARREVVPDALQLHRLRRELRQRRVRDGDGVRGRLRRGGGAAS